MNELLNVNEQRDNGESGYNQVITSEWTQLIATTSQQSFNLLRTLAVQKASDFADEFYIYMLKDQEASLFLSSQQVHDRLHGSMSKWIADILTNTGDSLADLINHQKKIGQIHARIGIPVDLVERGARRLKWHLYEHIAQVADDKALCFDAMRFASISMDIAIEIMSKTYSQSHDLAAKNEESYRLFSILENASMERERQNASLLNWENAFIFSVATGTPLSSIQDLSDSDFGLWFNHKGKSSFSNIQGIRTIATIMTETDEYIRNYSHTALLTQQDYAPLLKAVRSKIYKINMLLGSLFDEVQKLESGKDTLTLLLNRRFLPTILRHEISLTMHSNTPLSIAMIDIDHFKSVNDTYGHAAGDNILKRIAEILYESTRNSDYVFRYGGEEFLIVLIETPKVAAHTIIERLRKKIENHFIHLQNGESVKMTISAGIAVYSGHPDYECLIKAADDALYQAKANGRNRIEYAPE
ncbi:diguanylate cyclase [Pectobacterium atrosepticum]|uniref:diguanylate cyclase n=1 Tax=Pectobacterium atrosepticum TaxID=29471 RepID=UPI0002DA0E85|nr:diguanylate cyclase [Pectobacterium atrosepticum]GKV84216.1 diguanylate cyclase [Pectobacterium carotovorum subsp. carotovorum]AIA70530.1 diguanylate cyclase [Pectobacterium atrosepticum]AIK14704.1 diguanylate cyclase [Pectobacterium atrosepticum]ATY91443.1 diguanylate cyclase [Pectobacterium atrosepticum]KFX17620.1 diguanylate cyclase [Pectobacterium atrosepticum]